MQAARNGLVVRQDGETIATESAAEVRARLVRAARVYEARLIAGHDEEESVEAEAGAVLEAETANAVTELREFAEAWAKAHSTT